MKKSKTKKIKPVVKKKFAKKPKISNEINGTRKIKIKVIGIGNGGGAIVADIAQDIRGVKFLAANSDKLALLKLKRRVATFQFGQDVTQGWGAGMDVALGQEAAEKETEKIKKILQGCDLCILIACLGGGTGSGAAPVFARLSKELGNLTYGIFTFPFDFEGRKKLEVAKETLKKLESFVNIITIVPNERIFKIVDKKQPLKKALSDINKILAFNLEGIIDMIHKPGIINIDFADFRTILKGQAQLAYLNRAGARGENRAKKALQQVLSSPLHDYNISQAKKVLFNVAGPNDLSISEVAEISRGIFDSIQKGSKIIFGASRENNKGMVDISLLAVGCAKENFFPAFKKKIKKKKPIKPENKIESDDKAVLEIKARADEEKKQQSKLEISTQEDNSKEDNSKQVVLPETVKQEKNAIVQTALLPEVVKEEKKVITSKPKKKKKSRIINVKKEKIRKNALEVQKAIEELEKEMNKKEEIWETPAFLRRKI